jgi:RecA-family ATPase
MAVYQTGTGAYRISSKVLGRDLEEDLSIAPTGIKDFGVHDMGDPRHGGRTPIDLLMEWGGYEEPKDAAFKLCELLDREPVYFGWEDSRSTPKQPQQPLPPLPFIDISAWINEDVPPREWTVRDIIARRTPFLISGEGAAGKTLVMLQLAVAHTLGKDWLGTLPEPGPVIFLSAEDETDEMHRRLHDILNFYGASFADIAGQLHLLSYAGEDAVLARTDRRTGLVMATPLYNRMLEAAANIKPIMTCLDTSADVFAGDEISRFEVRQFVGMLRKLAIIANGAVILTSHPSNAGISTGTGLSGSTGWHNSVRGRAYLTAPKTDKDDEPDPTLRLLEFKKSNYGPVARSMSLRYEHGVYRLVGGASSMDRLAREQTAERLFLALLDHFNDQGRNVSDKPSSKTYAPTMFAKEADAGKYGVRKADFEAAMRRLFAASKIAVEPYGPKCRGTTHLVTR